MKSIHVATIVAIAAALSVSMGCAPGRKLEAQVAVTRATIKNVGSAVEMFKIDHGVRPKNLDELVTDTGHHQWRGPYILDTPTDAWGRKLTYTKMAMGVTIQSAGPDGVFGTEDDIVNTN